MFVKMHYFTSMYVYSIVCRILYHKMKQFLYSSSIFSVYCNANFLNNGGKNNNIYIYFFHPELCQFLKMVICKLCLINIIMIKGRTTRRFLRTVGRLFLQRLSSVCSYKEFSNFEPFFEPFFMHFF